MWSDLLESLSARPRGSRPAQPGSEIGLVSSNKTPLLTSIDHLWIVRVLRRLQAPGWFFNSVRGPLASVSVSPFFWLVFFCLDPIKRGCPLPSSSSVRSEREGGVTPFGV